MLAAYRCVVETSPDLNPREGKIWTQLKLGTYTFPLTIPQSAIIWSKRIESERFPNEIGGDQGHWLLRIDPASRGIMSSEDFVSIWLVWVPQDDANTEIQAEFKCSILNAENQLVHTNSLGPCKFNESTRFWGFPCFIKRATLLDKANQLMRDTEFHIFCEISIIEDLHTNLVQHVFNLHKFCNNKKYSDLTICTGDKNFHVHRVILAIRSPGFAKMLDSHEGDANKGRIELTDINHEVMEAMLHFIYTNDVKELETAIAFDLFEAAKRFALGPLEVACEEHLQKSVSSINAVKTLVFADRHCVESLKRTALDFICDNIVSVSSNPDYKSLKCEQSYHLLDAIIDALAKKANGDSNGERNPKKSRNQ